MKRIIIPLFALYFSAICQHTAAQLIPGPVIPVPGPAIPVPVPATVPEGEYFRQDGVASWYGYQFEGRPTASGEIYNSSQLTAAHPTLPFGTILMVTNRQNNRQVAVRVNDRGPFVGGRIIDLSRAAAEQLDMLITGTAPVTIDKIQANHPLYSTPSLYLQPQMQPQVLPQPPGYLPPQPLPQPPGYLPPQALPQPPGYLPPQAFQQPPGYLPPQAFQPGYVLPQQAPALTAQPMLPPPQRLPPMAQQPVQAPITPILIPTPPPVPAEAPPQPAPYAPVTVQVFPSTQTTTITPNPTDLPGGPRARLNPSITPLPNRIYKLQVGSYKIAGNAVDAYVKLKTAGLEPSYERNGDFFRVVLAGVRGSDMDSVTGKLGTAGFREAVIREER